MIGCVAVNDIFPKAKYCNGIFYVKGGLILLEFIGLMVLLSKYFAIILIAFCMVVGVINNMLYLVVLGGVLLVVFIVSMLIGSLRNVMIPVLFLQLSYFRGIVFLLIIVLLIMM